jgi:hypothetical protein
MEFDGHREGQPDMSGRNNIRVQRLRGPIEPTLARAVPAFAIAPITAGIPCAIAIGLFMAFSGGTWSSAGWLTAVAGSAVLVGAWAYPVALVIGVPLFFLMRGRVPVTPLASTLVGATIGAFTAMGMLAVAAPQLRNGLLLKGLIGWPHLLALGLMCGALPGLTFCAIATRGFTPRTGLPANHPM